MQEGEQKNGNDPTPLRHPFKPWHRWIVLGVAILVTVVWLGVDQTMPRQPSISYSRFYQLVDDGLVESVTITGDVVTGQLVDEQTIDEQELDTFRTRLPDQTDGDVVELMRERDVAIDVEPEKESSGWSSVLLMLLPWVLILGFWFWVSRQARGSMSKSAGALKNLMGARVKRFDRARHVRVSFDDVAGLDAAKQDLREIVAFLKEPERFAMLGAKVPRGVLLAGAPGTGKTLLARAVAGEADVPFFSLAGSDFIEMFVGVGAARVRELFEACKSEAPAIVFIDEIDAVGRARGTGLGGGHDEREQTLNQLLHEMDGFEPNDRVVVLAATNRPDVLDAALLRPGRFDRRIEIDRPAYDARVAILEVHTKEKPVCDDVDLQSLARSTAGFSGADLANLVNEAAMLAARRSGLEIEAVDFETALDKLVLGSERELRLSPEERHRIAVHEAGHTVVAHTTERGHTPRRVSIIPRGNSLGSTQRQPEADRYVVSRPELEAELAMLLAGHAAEQLVLHSVSTGAEDDLRKASALAQRMVASFGMSEEIGPVYHELNREHPFLGRQMARDSAVSDATVHRIEQEAHGVLTRAMQTASRLLEEHRDLHRRLVAQLLEYETLQDEELEALLGPSPASHRGSPHVSGTLQSTHHE